MDLATALPADGSDQAVWMLLPSVFAGAAWGWPVGLLVAAAQYLIACWWWPWARCWRCRGRGKFRSASGRVWRDCPRCGGSGRRLRVGRYLLAAAQGAVDE